MTRKSCVLFWLICKGRRLGLELLRDMCVLKGAEGEAVLCLGIGNDSIELRLQKSEALQSIYFPERQRGSAVFYEAAP